MWRAGFRAFHGPKRTCFRDFSASTVRLQNNPRISGGQKWSKTAFMGSLCVLSAIAGYVACDKVSERPNTASTTSIEQCPPLKYASPSELELGIARITAIVGPNHVTNSPGELENHSKDPSGFVLPLDDEKPALVVYPQTVEQVSQVMKTCYELRIPVVPYSGGTSIEGHYIPTRRGVCIDLGRMDRILELHEQDLDVVVEPGVGWTELNEYLKPYGLLYGPDPAPGALIGGILATNASGTNAVRFGAAKDNILSLTVVLADGTVIKTKKRPRKSSNGYNLTNLFVGSEGTLGIIVEATLKLHPRPQNEVIAMMNFRHIGDATRCVSDLVRQGIVCNAIELMDERQMTAVSEMGTGGSRKWAPYCLLLVKLGAANKAGVKQITNSVCEIARENQGFNVEVAEDEEAKEDIWRVRKTLLWNSLEWARKIRPNARILPTDVCVPVSKLPELITRTMDRLSSAGLLATAAGHAGDGNVHVLVIFEPEQAAIAQAEINEMSRLAIELDGTISGEHGIGVSDKRELLESELGVETVDLMRRVKFALDGRGVLNPDHVFRIDKDDERMTSE